MSVPARVLNEIFLDKVNTEGPDSVLSLLSTFIEKQLEEDYGENNVEIGIISFTKLAATITLVINATIRGKTFSETAEWIELDLLTSDKPVTDHIIEFLDKAFEVSSEDTSVS